MLKKGESTAKNSDVMSLLAHMTHFQDDGWPWPACGSFAKCADVETDVNARILASCLNHFAFKLGFTLAREGGETESEGRRGT